MELFEVVVTQPGSGDAEMQQPEQQPRAFRQPDASGSGDEGRGGSARSSRIRRSLVHLVTLADWPGSETEDRSSR